MAILFNKEQTRYIELNLFATNELDWLTYSICGGNMYQQKRIELFRLDNSELFFHNAAYEKEVENIIDGLRNIKESHHYRFKPVDEGEFRLESDYKDNMVYIRFQFYIIDIMENGGIKDNIFEIETTYLILCEFLTQLRKEYDIVTTSNCMNFIRDIINEWDPICLFPMAPKDEYEEEIAQICNLLRKEKLSIERIEEGIEKIFIKSFGEDLLYTFMSKDRCKEVARKLYQIADLIVSN